MFNLGGNDKEKLKENMEEIKDLVNSQESGNSMPQQENQPENSVEQENDSQLEEGISAEKKGQLDISSQLDQSESSQMDSNQVQPQNSMNHQENSGLQNNTQDMESGSGFRPVSEDGSTESSNIGAGDSPQSRSSSDSNFEEKLDNFNSQRDQSQELDVESEDQAPKGSGETLFLEVDEFNQVQEMVDEMKYLSREMNDLMENLEGGVEEDRRIESEAQDVIDEFAQRRKNIEASIN